MASFFDFHAHPGHFYVVATLLPLVSFVVLLLTGAVRWAVRPYRETSGAARSLHAMLGGDSPGRTGAYIATAAIVAAFVFSLVGFLTFLNADDASHAGPDEHGHAVPADDHHQYPVWAGSFQWTGVEAPTNKGATGPAGGLRLGYYIDSLSASMFLMITLIASLIHIFSLGYMGDELKPQVEDHQAHVTRKGRYPRFFMYLSLFCFSMLNLVLADNLFQVFVSWELVGICSYLLIGFYYERRTASNAANKAFITNRVGDAGFLIGMLILWTYLGTFNHQEIFGRLRAPERDTHGTLGLAGQVVRADQVEEDMKSGERTLLLADDGDEAILFPRNTPMDHWHGIGPVTGHDGKPRVESEVFVEAEPPDDGFGSMPYWLLVLAGVGIFLGCVGKSAQFPLQVWLPDAMEGPTPVSALIHAATMVAAGVYLVGRVFPMFVPEVMLVIAYTGAITAFIAATIAIVQTDIKKVLAYSTVSQLGFMMLALGVGGWAAGLFHLLTHAFFKALLFLGSGSVIYGCHHEQEMTKMGGLHAKMKITSITMLIGVLAIAGTPMFSGWFSKDAILVSTLSFASMHPQHFLLFLIPVLTAGITAFYMFRLWFMTFAGKPRDEHVYEHAHESPRVMTVPLIVLAFFSVTVAWGFKPIGDTHIYYPVPWDVHGSALEHFLHTAQPASVAQDPLLAASYTQVGANFWREDSSLYSPALVRSGIGPHDLAGLLALFAAGVGVLFAFVVYYWGALDPAVAKAQFPGVHRFLWNKWRFDELYSVVFVRPALVIAGWCRWFDTKAIDRVVDTSARVTVKVSKGEGRFDNGVVDGLVNLTANVVYGVGHGLRVVQTGLIRNYVLFLALAAVGIFAILSYVIGLAG